MAKILVNISILFALNSAYNSQNNYKNSNMQLNQSISQQDIVTWIRNNFYYPNCAKVKAISDIKSGVPVAQILTQLIPDHYHSMLLSRVEVSNLNCNTCVSNWRVIKQVLLNYLNQCKSHIVSDMIKKVSNISGQAMYYREQDLIKFITQILMQLKQLQKQLKQTPQSESKQLKRTHITYSNTIMAHLLSDNQQQRTEGQKRQSSNAKSYLNQSKKGKKELNNNANVNVSQLSDIANNSYGLIPFSNAKKNYQINHTEFLFNHDEQQEGGQGQIFNQEHNNQQQPHILVPPQYDYLSENLSEWLMTKLNPSSMTESHQLLGHLVNTIFCSSRLHDYIIKDAHFSHGAIFVYRKLLDFLLTNPSAERVSKTNALNMMKRIQQEGVVRQIQFWKLVQDIYIYDVSKGKGYPQQIHSSVQKQNNKHAVNKKQKQQNELNRKNSKKTLSKCKTSKQSLNNNNNLPKDTIFDHKIIMNDVLEAERWLQNDLGFQHTLSKIHSSQDIYANPLINGTLVSSILMRLKISKPLINKYPTNIDHLRNNWDVINKGSSLRGYQIFKKVCSILLKHNISELNTHMKQLINLFLVILKQFKEQHLKKNPQRKNKSFIKNSDNKCNECQYNYTTKPIQQVQSGSSKKQLSDWLSLNFSLNIDINFLSVQQLTQICRQLLNVNIYKETTARIQMNNVQKILGELRRIGLSDYYKLNKQDVMGAQDHMRWKIISDLKWLIDGKIQFCRA